MRTPTARLLRAMRSSTPQTQASLSTTIDASACLPYRTPLVTSCTTLTPSIPHLTTTTHNQSSYPSSLRLRSFSSTTTLSAAKQNQPKPQSQSQSRRTRAPTPSAGKEEDSEGLEENTSGDSTLSALNVLADVAGPSTAIDACLHDGFHLDNGVKITDGDGCLLVDGEAFRWRPWEAAVAGKDGTMRAMINEKGQWEVGEEVWGVLRVVWPKPDLLILGLGASVHPISPETRRQINLLGIRIEVQDTRNAAAQFNLLATERGVREVAAALIPIGWKGR
ncbi:hypothetical protein AJ79_09046 [Helicocarpus griseus UAMH5409]|uniref:NADH dehydrogenase [ubiquinone] 1 alpha subcomplex assembly factor 3 n=1 Tax=Helicocarpus griseus UAMH5409 TaxID=1447875 RepID=A0A2B7WER4_9EURO|nr:hypothetical protein AJ79_09046 [Helicocarpus griseus UAMH5409]